MALPPQPDPEDSYASIAKEIHQRVMGKLSAEPQTSEAIYNMLVEGWGDTFTDLIDPETGEPWMETFVELPL